jgi:hypothetical protein
MTTLQKHIRDLIFFYVKTNYEKYLEEHGVSYISDNQLAGVIDNIYSERKPHIKIFIKSSLKELLNAEYPGDLIINNILQDILNDDELCKTRILTEIQTYQKKKE